MNIIEKEICFGDLYGVAYIPDNIQTPLPTVILCHGIYASHQMTAPSAKLLAARGMACYCFDFRGGAYSHMSGGDVDAFSISTETDDLRSVVDGVKELDFVEESRLFLYGESMGGAVAALVAAERQDEIAGLMLMYPALNMPDFIRHFFPDPQSIPDRVDGFLGVDGLNLGKQFFSDVLSIDFYQEAGKFKGPVLITHGTEDKLVPLAYSERANQMYANSELIILSDAPHGYSLTEALAEKAHGFVSRT